MATTHKKRKRPRRKKKKAQRGWLKKSVLALFFMALGGVIYALFSHNILEKRTQSSKQIEAVKLQPAVRKEPVKKTAPAKLPQPEIPDRPYEIYPEKESVVDVETLPANSLPPNTLPRIAIIIDDLGQDKRMARKFLDLPGTLTFSVLPQLPHSRHVADAAWAKKWEVMVHLPMEPQEYPSVNPGPGALLMKMTPDVLIDQLRKDLAAIPGAVGVNNHMGSRLTAQSSQMNQVFSELKRQDLFFIDSLTTGNSVAGKAARLFQVPFGQRHVFLDHHPNRRFIEKQLALLLKKAQRRGIAIGIGHPYQITWQVLNETIPRLKEAVRLIPASQAVGILS